MKETALECFKMKFQSNRKFLITLDFSEDLIGVQMAHFF